MSFLSYLKDGISLGSIYAIIALGYTMVYGIAKMLNFAHGDVIMVGAFVILTAVTKGGMSPVLAIVLSVIFCTVLGMVIEKVAYSPLRKASSNLAVLITAIGVSYLLQNLALLIFGADAKSFVTVIDVPSVSLFDGQLVIKGITIVTILMPEGKVSSRCIRACVADAKWVYENCNGSRLRVFDGKYSADECYKGPRGFMVTA